MELIWKELDAERLIARESVQVHIDGELPSPDGRIPSEIPAVNAQVAIDGASLETGEVRINGKIKVTLTALDEAGMPFGYESSAQFTHTVKMPEALPGMRAFVTPTVQTVSVFPDGKGALLDSDVDLSVWVVSSVPLKVTGGISGVNDLELKTRTVRLTERKLLGKETLMMREELSADGISDVIFAEGQIFVRDVSIEQGAASVSGTVTVSAVTNGSCGRLGQIVRQIPFRERVGVNGVSSDICCSASLDSIALRALGEEFALISMEAEITLNVYGVTEKVIVIPVDAFSPTIGFDCLYEDVELLSNKGMDHSQVTIKETLPLPDNAPEINAPLFVSARPLITAVEAGSESLEITGVLMTSAAYESASGRLFSFNEEVPFTAQATNTDGCNMPIVTASSTAQITGTTERGLLVQYSLLIETERYGLEAQKTAVGLAEKELPDRKSGILISFASEGEEIFDAAKRFGVSCDSVRELNPDIREPLSEGDRLIMLV